MENSVLYTLPRWHMPYLVPSSGPHPVIQSFDIAELRERIYQHVPPPGRESPYGGYKRSKSFDAIASYRVTEESHSMPRRRKA